MSRGLIPSDRQMQAMVVLWQLGSGTVAQVQAALNEWVEPEIARTTTLTHLRILRAEGWVQVQKEGAGYRYYPAVTLRYARWLEVWRITDLLYGGSREALLNYLLMEKGTPRWLLERLRGVLERRLAESPPQRSTGSTRCEGSCAVR